MKQKKFKRFMIARTLLAIMLCLNLSLGIAATTYRYTTQAITLENFDIFNFTSFPQLQEISNGDAVTVSITLDSPLPANTTTNLSANNLIGFSTDPDFLSSRLLTDLMTRQANTPFPLESFGRRTASGQLTTDVNGDIEDWKVTFRLAQHDHEPYQVGSFHISSTMGRLHLFPLTVNGESINSLSDINSAFHVIQSSRNLNRYDFQVYDWIRSSNGDEDRRTEQTHYTAAKGHWSRTDAAQADPQQTEPQLVYIPLDTTCRVVDTRGFSSPFQIDRLSQSFRAYGSQAELDTQRDDDHSKNLPACQPIAGFTPAAIAANVTAAARLYKSTGNITAQPSRLANLDSSLINFQSNNIANASIIALSSDNDAHFDIHAQLFIHQGDTENQHKVDVIVDISGYFYDRAQLDPSTAAQALTYVPLTNPCRIVDTRATHSPLTQANNTQSFLAWGNKTDLDAQRDPANSTACLPVSGVQPSAMVSNITAVAKPHKSKGNLAVYASDATTPESSLVNFQKNTIANASIVSLSGDNDQHFKLQAHLFGDEADNRHNVDAVVDVMGYFYPQTAFEDQNDRPDMVYQPLASPCRIVDTRGFDSAFTDNALSIQSFRAWGNQTELDLQRDSDHSKQLPDCLPNSAANPSALVANVTAAARSYQSQGNIVAYAQGTSAPTSSLINFQGNNIANTSILAINPDNDLHFNIQAHLFGHQADNEHKVDVIIDAMGYFHPLASKPGSEPSDPITVPSKPGTTTRISVSSDGQEADAGSGFHPPGNTINQAIITRSTNAISADGRFVAFQSLAGNLVSDDTNIKEDIFVHDRLTGEVKRVSVTSTGDQAEDRSLDPSISADGRFVTFMSQANNLSEQDTNRLPDIYVHDRQSGETKLVSVASDGTQSNSDCYTPTISADGRFIAFVSWATNLATGDSNGSTDIYVHDRQTGTTERVSLSPDGTEFVNSSEAPAISADGRFISFHAKSHFPPTGTPNVLKNDVYVRDRQTGVTELVSVTDEGIRGASVSTHPAISADGRWVAFQSSTVTLIPGTVRDYNSEGGIRLYDRQTGITEHILSSGEFPEFHSQTWPWPPAISADGRYIASYSNLGNLVADDNNDVLDVFVHDRQTQKTRRVSVSSDGLESHDDPLFDRHPASYRPSPTPTISADGKFVVFRSKANDLVTGDTNDTFDVFVHELTAW